MIIILIFIWLIIFYLLFKANLEKNIPNITFIIILFYLFIWHFMPIILSFFGIEGSKFYYLIEKKEYLNLAILESLSYFFVIYLFIKKNNFIKINNSFKNLFFIWEYKIIIILIILGIVGFLMMQISFWEGGYLAINTSFDLMPISTFGKIGIYGFFASIGYACTISVLLSNDYLRTKIKNIKLIALLYFATCSIFYILSGSRIHLFAPFILFAIYYRNKSKSIKNLVIILLAVLIIGILISGTLAYSIGMLRTSPIYGFKDIIESSKEGNLRQGFQELFIKFDSISPGAILLKFDGPGKGGLMPYVGSVLAIIPRYIYPEKPFPGSKDGTASGDPARYVPRLAGIFSESLNVGVSTVAITIWQFGYIGIILFILMNWLNLIIINEFLVSSSLILKSLGIFNLGFPSLFMVFTSPDKIIMNQFRIWAIILILLILNKFTSSIRVHLL
jgi:hypothetical protein